MDIFKTLLLTHIVCGGTSLVLGLFVLLSKKGNIRHKFVGNLYFLAMLIAALVALPMAYLRANYFLFIIGVFTAYMLLTGKRYLKKKKVKDVKALDWALTITMFLFGAAFIVLGAYMLLQSNTFGTVLLVFGGLSLLFVSQDYRNFKGKSNVRNYWLTTHIKRMIGSYIASATAFLVVNNTFLPSIVAWLLPTALFVPLLIIWSRKHEIKNDA